jgi:hypothetical protein
MKRPFFWYQDFWPSDLDLELLTYFWKTFNLDYILWIKCVRVLILEILIYVLWGDLSFSTKTVDLVTLILNFDLVLTNFNLDYIFWTKCVRAFDTGEIDALQRVLSIGTNTFDLVTWILNFDPVLKTLTWTISFKPNVLGLWYLNYRCIMKRPFFWYQDFWPSDIDLKLWSLPGVILPGKLCCLLTF